MNAEAAGLRLCAPLPWPIVGKLTKAMLPATIALLVGDPGAGKTFAVLEALNVWTGAGVPASVLMLEKDRAWHLRRCLAMLLKDMRALDDEAVRQQPAWYASRPGEMGETLDAIGRALWDSTHCGSSLDNIAGWIDQQADAGSRVIVVDPISLADTSDKPWVEHDRFLRQVRRSIERTHATLILATHPRGGQKSGPPTIDDLAGSRVMVQRADSVLWLKAVPPRRAACVHEMGSCAAQQYHTINRVMRVLKCRDGSASGMDFGLQWNVNAGGFTDRGIVAEWLDDEAHAGDLPEGL
jgi:hypothetical protein